MFSSISPIGILAATAYCRPRHSYNGDLGEETVERNVPLELLG